MNKPIKLHPTDLIAVEVPSDATEVRRSDFEILGEINKDKISVGHNDNIDLMKLLKENGLYFEAQEKLIILKPIL